MAAKLLMKTKKQWKTDPMTRDFPRNTHSQQHNRHTNDNGNGDNNDDDETQ